MVRKVFLLLLCLLTTVAASTAEKVSFNRQVRPILSDRCFKCHGPDAKNQKSSFRLDTEEHAFADLGGYAGIVPGDLNTSEVHHRIHSTDASELMPPPNSNLHLTDAEKAILDTWIQQGATFEGHWSFQPVPASVPVPEHEDGWARNAIDHFVHAQLRTRGLKPAQESPREKWLRRVSFDLTGLPPTLAEIDSFLADQSDDAFESVVDRLLHSDAHAERMTSEWLDVARYSDSYGYQRDHERYVWPWRDWVLSAFRKNTAYDEFITLQLAGDLLPNATQDQILPTAFNRLHGHVMEGGIVLEEFRVEYVADRTQTFGSAFLGLTFECARCHDHKYDPLPTKDYYALSAFFANIDEAGLISYFTEETPTPAIALQTPEDSVRLEKAQQDIERAELALARVVEESRQLYDKATPSSEVQAEQIAGLVADVSFDDFADGQMSNAARPGDPVTSSAANVSVAGKFGNALRLTGDDPVEVPQVGYFPREQPFSASIWIRMPGITPRANIFSRSGGGDDAAHIGYELVLLDGKPTASLIHFWPGNAIRVRANDPLEPNKWHHLSVSYDGSSQANGLQIYHNGDRLETTILKDHLNRQITQWTGGRQDLVIGQRYRDRGFVQGEVDSFRLFDRELSHYEIQVLSGRDQPSGSRFDYDVAAHHQPIKEARAAVQEARRHWNQIMDAIPDISIMRELPEPRPTYVLQRGAYDAHGERVEPNTPSALPPFPAHEPRNRLGLARWLTAPTNPLASRVAVNRYWQMLFGRGLVRTQEDFGSQGAPPTHPELLDWLVRDFMNHAWDLHHLLKQMVLSATYRQSTVTDQQTRNHDPENQYLSRSSGHRLPAEMIRDNALAVSGLLVDRLGGEPVKPYEVEASFSPVEADKGEGLYRRSLYTWWKRNAPAPMMVTFDAPKRDVCAVKREQTASPMQSLVLLNSPQFMEAARTLGAELVRNHGNDSTSLVEQSYRILTSRQPNPDETAILTTLLQEQESEFNEDPAQADALLAVGNAPNNVNLPKARVAAATVLVNSLMNLDESIQKR